MSLSKASLQTRVDPLCVLRTERSATLWFFAQPRASYVSQPTPVRGDVVRIELQAKGVKSRQIGSTAKASSGLTRFPPRSISGTEFLPVRSLESSSRE